MFYTDVGMTIIVPIITLINITTNVVTITVTKIAIIIVAKIFSIAMSVGEIYIRIMLSLLFLRRLLLGLLLRILQFFVCINRGLNDIVFHYALYLEKSKLPLVKPNVDKVVLTIFVWILKFLKRFLCKLKLV